MWTGSKYLVPALQAGLRVAAKLEVWTGAGSPSGAPSAFLQSVPFTTLSVTMARDSQQRGTCSAVLTNPDPALVPASSSDLLDPLSGNELRPYFGVKYPTGVPQPTPGSTPYIARDVDGATVEYVPMGVFPIVTATPTDTLSGVSVALSAFDRSWVVGQRALQQPYPIASGTTAYAAVTGLVATAFPGAVWSFDWTLAERTLPAQTVRQGADPFAEALKIVTALGCVLYLDRQGVFVASPVPDPTSAYPVLPGCFGEGQASLVSQLQHPRTRDGLSNDVTITASGSANALTGTTTPLAAQAKDTNTNSPTYVGGPLGDLPHFESSTVATDAGGAGAAATNLLRQYLGGVDKIVATTKPLPLLDVDDVVEVSRSRLKVAGPYVVDSVTMSTRHDTQSTIHLRKVAA